MFRIELKKEVSEKIIKELKTEYKELTRKLNEINEAIEESFNDDCMDFFLNQSDSIKRKLINIYDCMISLENNDFYKSDIVFLGEFLENKLRFMKKTIENNDTIIEFQTIVNIKDIIRL